MGPNCCLSRMPQHNSPFLTMNSDSVMSRSEKRGHPPASQGRGGVDIHSLGLILAVEVRLGGNLFFGTKLVITVEMICFPDYNSWGFRMAGG